MSIEQIKAEVAEMPEEQQNQLMAYMVHLRHERDPQARREITSGMTIMILRTGLRLNSSKNSGRNSLNGHFKTLSRFLQCVKFQPCQSPRSPTNISTAPRMGSL